MAENVNTTVDKISKFVYWLAHHNCSTTCIMMEFDELVGELFVEIAKGLDVYGDRPENELLAILRRMCDNRLAELKTMHYRTHRAAGNNPVDIQELSREDDADGYIMYKVPNEYLIVIDPGVLSSSVARVMATRARLSPNAVKVFDAVILTEDERVAEQIRLAGIRASAIFVTGGTVKIKPWHVAEALNMKEALVRRCFREIRQAYKEVVNG